MPAVTLCALGLVGREEEDRAIRTTLALIRILLSLSGWFTVEAPTITALHTLRTHCAKGGGALFSRDDSRI